MHTKADPHIHAIASQIRAAVPTILHGLNYPSTVDRNRVETILVEDGKYDMKHKHYLRRVIHYALLSTVLQLEESDDAFVYAPWTGSHGYQWNRSYRKRILVRVPHEA